MALLLTESLDSVRREEAHQHIESCAECSAEWLAYNETWRLLADIPDREVPPRVKEKFLAEVMPPVRDNVVPMYRRRAPQWLAQAAAVAIIAGGGFYAGRSRAPIQVVPQTTPATINSVQSLAETRVIPSSALSSTIEGRPDIKNVQFVDTNPADSSIGVSFDVKSRWTVTGKPDDKSMVRLLTYVLENEDDGASLSRSRAIDWVKQTYSRPDYADPEIARALARVLRNETHEGVRMAAVETLKDFPVAIPSADTRSALIDALKSDPNPAVRLKAIEALANMARQGGNFDTATVDTLRAKASQDDENVYVRVKAAELLKDMNP
jgi:hypothetical protein